MMNREQYISGLWYEMEEKRVADEVTKLAANKETARQQVALAAALEPEEAARTHMRRQSISSGTEWRWPTERWLGGRHNPTNAEIEALATTEAVDIAAAHMIVERV
jgi:hypothetical protein